MCQQDLPNLILDHQVSMKTQSEDQALAKSKHLMPSQDQSQPPLCANRREKQQVQRQEEARGGILAKEAPSPVSHTSQMEEDTVPQSPEYQLQVPFLKLLSECGEKLGIKDPSQKLTPDTSRQLDLQLEKKAAFRE